MKKILIILLIILSCRMAYAQVLFFDDFETQDFSAWSGASSTNPLILNGGAGAITTSQSHSGLYSFKATLPAPGGYVKTLENIPSQTSFYLLYYLYVDSDWSQTNPVVLSNSGEEVLLRQSAGSLYLKDNNGNQGTHVISKGTWHSIQVYQQAGSGNAVGTVWLDGIQDINSHTLTMSPFTVVSFGLDNADGTQSGSIYFDDVTISTASVNTPVANITVRYPNTNARSAIPVDVTMFGQNSTDNLVASVNGTTVYTKTGSMTAHERFSVILSSLSVGSHTLQVQLQNSEGTPKSTYSGSIQKYVGGTPTVYIDDENNLYWAGSKYFPVTPFIDGGSEWSTVWLANAAVNTYGWVDCWQNGYAYTYTEFNGCMNTIGHPFIGPDNNWTGASGSVRAANAAGAVATATNYVTKDKGNSNLFMWTWQDEPDVGGGSGQVSPATMLSLSQVVWNNDGNHPVITNMAGYPFSFIADRQHGWHYPIIPNSSALVSDVYASDMYPFIYRTSGWTVAQMVAGFDWARRYTYNLVPWIAFIEAGICKNGACTGYGPTAAQVKMEAWLAIIHGIKGVSWWGPNGWTSQDAAHWTALAQFVTDTTYFRNAILSNTTRTVASNQTGGSVDSRVDVAVREDNNNIYIFAARLTDVGESGSALATQITISGSPNGVASVYNESRNVPVINGILTDNFDDSAVHIYVIPHHSTPSQPVLM